MPPQYCNEFLVGICTKKLFKLDGLTEECTFEHSEYEQENFRKTNVLFGFENEVLKKYNLIISECDRKIENLKERLDFIEITESSERQKLIKFIDIVNEKMEKYNYLCYSLLKLKGDATERLINIDVDKRKSLDVVVCDVCGSFYKKNGNCIHLFHNAYQSLRDKRQELYEKISKMVYK